MSDLKYIENKVRKVNELANELAHKANNEINVLKHKITCLTILVALFAIIGACIAFYSIHSSYLMRWLQNIYKKLLTNKTKAV